jgi:hypothetical protein
MIRIHGHLGATVLSAFPALAPQHQGAHTVLTGLLDQSALYGVPVQGGHTGNDGGGARQAHGTGSAAGESLCGGGRA